MLPRLVVTTVMSAAAHGSLACFWLALSHGAAAGGGPPASSRSGARTASGIEVDLASDPADGETAAPDDARPFGSKRAARRSGAEAPAAMASHVRTIGHAPDGDRSAAASGAAFANTLFGSSRDDAADALLYGSPSPGGQGAPHAQAPRLGGYVNWECPWPSAGVRAGVDFAVAQVTVDVDVKGTAKAAHLIEEPGYGFGADAVACAMNQRFVPGVDARGKAVAGTTAPFAVRFNRRRSL